MVNILIMLFTELDISFHPLHKVVFFVDVQLRILNDSLKNVLRNSVHKVRCGVNNVLKPSSNNLHSDISQSWDFELK